MWCRLSVTQSARVRGEDHREAARLGAQGLLHQGGPVLAVVEPVGKEPDNRQDQQDALRQGQHRRVQQEVGQVGDVQAVLRLRRARHDEVRHVRGQDRGGEDRRGEPHRQDRTVAAGAPGREAEGVAEREHHRDQQGDAPEIRRHHEGDGEGQGDDARR